MGEGLGVRMMLLRTRQGVSASEGCGLESQDPKNLLSNGQEMLVWF